LANTVGDNYKLNDGAISRSILERAGVEMQQELDSVKPQSASLAGDVVVTNGHCLSASYVFHGVLKKWTNGQDDSEAVSNVISFAKSMQIMITMRFLWREDVEDDSAPDV